jgi:hypothetical protein
MQVIKSQSSIESIKNRFNCCVKEKALIILSTKIQSELDFRHIAETYKDVDIKRVYDDENGWRLVICILG